MYNTAGEMLGIIKKVAVDAVEAGKPSTIVYGTVTAEKPLKIKLDQSILIEGEQITVPRQLTDYTVEVEILEHPITDVGGEEGHTHGLSRVKKIKIKNRLKKGHRVALQRMDGGQEFVILDRILGKGGDGGT